MKISNDLNPNDWSKKVAPLDKPPVVADALKTLNKAVDALPEDLLDIGGLDSVDAVKQRIGEIEGKFAKAAKLVIDQAKALALQAKKCEGDFKKDAKAPKTAPAAAAAVARAAGQLATDVGDASTKALTGLKALLAKFEAQSKKDAVVADKAKKEEAKNAKEDEEENADDLAAHKDEKKFRDKVKSTLLGWFKRVKAEGAPPAKFTVAVLGKTWGVYLAKSAGESEKKIAMRLAGLTSGFKHCKGIMFYDPKSRVWVFEGANIPLGRANATSMSLALKPIIGYAPRLRLQKPGERGEDSEGGEEDPDEKQQQAAGADPVKAFTARLAKLMPEVKVAMASGDAAGDRIRTALAKAAELINKGEAAQANKLADDVEKELVELGKKINLEDEEAAQPKEEASGQASLVKLGKARRDWVEARSQALDGIESLARRIEQEYRNETAQHNQVQAAMARVRALAGHLPNELEKVLDDVLSEDDENRRSKLMDKARVSLTNVVKKVVQDPVLKEIDGNELMPDLHIVKPLQESLRDIAKALG